MFNHRGLSVGVMMPVAIPEQSIVHLLDEAARCPASHPYPSKRFFALEDDIHSHEGLSYLGHEAETIAELLVVLAKVSDWTYHIYCTADFKLAALGTIYHRDSEH